MPRIQPLLPFLRPLSAPRVSANRQLFRFSTATRLRADDSNSSTPNAPAPPAAASKPSPETPVSSTSSIPSEASHAADIAATEAAIDADSAQSPVPKPTLPSKRPNPSKSSSKASSESTPTSNPSTTPTTPSGVITSPKKAQSLNTKARKDKAQAPKTKLELPPAKYVVSRTSNNNYPVYTDYKRGGNLHLTTVRKITGDLSALRDELRIFLNKKNEEVRISALTQHVIVKGHHAGQITEFLRARGM